MFEQRRDIGLTLRKSLQLCLLQIDPGKAKHVPGRGKSLGRQAGQARVWVPEKRWAERRRLACKVWGRGWGALGFVCSLEQ